MSRTKAVQIGLKKGFNLSLGYGFEDESIHEIWDNTLSEDLEILKMEDLIATRSAMFEDIIPTQSLHVTRNGRILLKWSIPPRLEYLRKGLVPYINSSVKKSMVS